MINSIVNSYKKELKNVDLKELNDNLIIDTGRNNMGKKIKKDSHQLRVRTTAKKQRD